MLWFFLSIERTSFFLEVRKIHYFSLNEQNLFCEFSEQVVSLQINSNDVLSEKEFPYSNKESLLSIIVSDSVKSYVRTSQNNVGYFYLFFTVLGVVLKQLFPILILAN